MAAALPPVTLVTGASRGIGRAIAQHLAKRGARVALHYASNDTAARDTLASLAGEGHALFRADVSDPAACERLVADVVARFGRLDVLVNNAGIYEDDSIKTASYSEWQRVWRRTLDTNLLGPANLTFLAVQHFRLRGGGRIVNITSRAAFRGELTAQSYAASKAALNITGQSLARALGADNIHVFTVAPGWIDTEMATAALTGPGAADVLAQHPLGRVGTADEMGTTVAWLALEAPANLTGCIIDANGASYLRT
ncbi:MAG: SDR family oxidoreductase [Candidatus Didemnitutus sp.]|nr:SDR family oxidoreductase [Candidatus Didemnitutus sp.]